MNTSKKIVITGYKEFGDISEKKTLVVMGDDSMEAQDGFHTFGELYEHRIALFITLCNVLYRTSGDRTPLIAWKSKLHSDGTMFDGWFVAGIGTEKGQQMSYHLPIKDWDSLRVVAYDKAPEWDGHTPEDVLERLKGIA